MTEIELAKMLVRNPDISVMANGTISAPVATVTRQPQVAKLSEHEMQVEIVQECQRRALTNPAYELGFAIPNGGMRSKSVGGILKAEGVRRGVPDLFWPVARRRGNLLRHGIFVECKVKPNDLDEHQRWWFRRLRIEGYVCEIAFDDPEAALSILEWYLGDK